MFLRKFLKVGDKGKWVLLELLIVFVGVYLAFVLQAYSETQKNKKEQEKVLVSLKLELEAFRISFPGFADFHQNVVDDWDSLFAAKKVGNFFSWRYLEPQYNFSVLEYALNTQGSEIISFELFESLSELYQDIKRLEHAERLITEMGHYYKIMPAGVGEDDLEGRKISAENRLYFYKVIGYSKDRIGILKRVASLSVDILEILNNQLGTERARAVNLEFIRKYHDRVPDKEYLREFRDQYFPDITEEELMQITGND
ncbi:MAG: hypothetical protein Roseis2KO_19450 [Roseivirga sp.]